MRVQHESYGSGFTGVHLSVLHTLNLNNWLYKAVKNKSLLLYNQLSKSVKIKNRVFLMYF